MQSGVSDRNIVLDPVSIQQELKQLGHYVSQDVITGFLAELGVECSIQDEEQYEDQQTDDGEVDNVSTDKMEKLQLGFQDMTMQKQMNSYKEESLDKNRHVHKEQTAQVQQYPFTRQNKKTDEIENYYSSSDNASQQHSISQADDSASESDNENLHDDMERPKTPCLPGMKPYSVTDLREQRDRLQQEFERIQRMYYNEEEFINTEDFNHFCEKENIDSQNNSDVNEVQNDSETQSQCSSIPASVITSQSKQTSAKKQKKTIQKLPNTALRTYVNSSYMVKGQSAKAAPKIDRVARYKQFERQWNSSGFLRARKEPAERKRQNFHQAFQEAHQREANMQLNAKLASIKRKQNQKQVDNKFVAPHEKRRDDLRWKTRMRMNVGGDQ